MLCGKIKKHIPLSNLKSGNTKTCGDRKKHKIQTTDLDLTNQTFGLLTALYPSDIKLQMDGNNGCVNVNAEIKYWYEHHI